MKSYTKICNICGKHFITEVPNVKFCSKECRMEQRRKKNAITQELMHSKILQGDYALDSTFIEPYVFEGNERLSEKIEKAKELGVTYGIYSAYLEGRLKKHHLKGYYDENYK